MKKSIPNYTPDYEYKQINSRNIVSDMEYQRVLDYNRVKRIVSSFNPDLVNPVKVSFRDGKYYVFDGQHTLQALKLKSGSGDLMVECKVYYGLTQEDEAKLFANQNGIQRNVDTNAKLKALYTSGDVDVCEMKESTEKVGVRMDFSKGNAIDKIVACGTALKIFKKVSSQEYMDMLKIIKFSWGGAAESYRQEILNAVYLFQKDFKGQYDAKKAVKQFSKVSPIQVIREGNLYSNKNQGYMLQLLQAYNKGLRAKLSLED